MISINHNWGFFSCCSVKLHVIIDYHNKTRELPIYVDGLRLFDWYKPKYRQEEDITYDYFERENRDSLSTFLTGKERCDYAESYQFSDYKTLDYGRICPFVETYFSPSIEIRSIIKHMEKKYKLVDNYENICVVFYRGNDKNLETNVCGYADMIEQAKRVQNERPGVLFLVQSDETEFIEIMMKEFPTAFYFKDEIRHMNRCMSTVDKVFKETNFEFSKKYLAITMIMAKCKTIICTTGNCSIWIMLFRKNADGVFQLSKGN